MPIAVAIIDGDTKLTASLRQIITAAEGFSCAGTYSSVEQALPTLCGANADVLLLDIQLPGISGDEALSSIRALCPQLRILMLTVLSDRDRLFASICRGAHGYLLKGTPPARLLDDIRAVREGGSPFSPEIACHFVHLFQNAGRQADPGNELTVQEKRLLRLLSDGYSYQAASDHMNVSVNTVRNYIRAVYQKLHVHSKSEAVGKA